MLNHQSMNCIYSGEALSPDAFSLDHFLPWSYVCHDQLWNLIPANRSANSSKGKSLPDTEQLEAFIIEHHRALNISRRVFGEGKWLSVTESYVDGLGIPVSSLLDLNKLQEAYRNRMNPLIALASQLGY